MFLFFGITPKTKRYGFVSSFCQVHGGEALHELSSYRSWFKLFFFLALFPVGRERHLLTCSQCGATYEVSPGEARQLAALARDVDGQYADPYPTAAGDEFRTTPSTAPERPMRVRSRRLDRGA